MGTSIAEFYDYTMVQVAAVRNEGVRYTAYNYWLNVFDGAMYTGGLHFVSAEVVLTALVRQLGGADWMIAYTPTLMLLGGAALPLLVEQPHKDGGVAGRV